MTDLNIHDVIGIEVEDINSGSQTVWRTIKILTAAGEVEITMFARNTENLIMIHRQQVIREND